MKQPQFRQYPAGKPPPQVAPTQYFMPNGATASPADVHAQEWMQQMRQRQEASLQALMKGALQDAMKPAATTLADNLAAKIHSEQKALLDAVHGLPAKLQSAIAGTSASHEGQTAARQQDVASQFHQAISEQSNMLQSSLARLDQIEVDLKRTEETLADGLATMARDGPRITSDVSDTLQAKLDAVAGALASHEELSAARQQDIAKQSQQGKSEQQTFQQDVITRLDQQDRTLRDTSLRIQALTAANTEASQETRTPTHAHRPQSPAGFEWSIETRSARQKREASGAKNSVQPNLVLGRGVGGMPKGKSGSTARPSARIKATRRNVNTRQIKRKKRS